MDTGKPPLEKDRELVSWTNSIKSHDSSSKLGTTDLSSFQESATSSPIRNSIANEIGPCAFARRMQDALTSLKLSGVGATFASTQPPIARISCHPIQDLARIQHLVLQICELQGITRHSFLPGFFSQNFRPISEVDFGHNISAQFCPNLSSISAQFKRLGAKMQDALFFCDT